MFSFPYFNIEYHLMPYHMKKILVYTVCGNKKDPSKQISLFSLQFNTFLQNFRTLFLTQFANIVANFIISPLVFPK